MVKLMEILTADDFSKNGVLNRFYEKFGRDVQFKALSEKDYKVVYKFTSRNEDFILIIIPHMTVTRFYKYMSSQGLQQQLFIDGMDAAEVVDAYIDGDNIVSVHRCFNGTHDFKNYEEMLKITGKTYGKLHRITMAPKYKNCSLLLQYPNVFVRLCMFVRYILHRRVSRYFMYYKLKDMPWGICHRDNNGQNVLFDKEGNTILLDFDKHRYMPLVEGLFYFYRKHLEDKSLFPIFLEAYEKERPLTDAERKHLEKKISDYDAGKISF